MKKYFAGLMIILGSFQASPPSFADETTGVYEAVPEFPIEDAQQLIHAALYGKTRIIKEVYQAHPEWMNVLIDVPYFGKNFQVASVGTAGCTLLHFATHHRKTKVVKLLLSLNADPRIEGTGYWHRKPSIQARYDRIFFPYNPYKKHIYSQLSDLLEEKTLQMN